MAYYTNLLYSSKEEILNFDQKLLLKYNLY